jgi:hypothetical protein
MKISTLLERLGELQGQHGDIDVWIPAELSGVFKRIETVELKGKKEPFIFLIPE